MSSQMHAVGPRRVRAKRFAARAMALGILGGVVQVVSAATTASASSVIGSWGPRFDLPLVVIHASVLPNEAGKVLLFSSRGPSVGSAAYLWDSATGALTNVSVTYSHDMMCGGNTMLSDGSVFVAGGRISAEKTSIFDPGSDTWVPGPSMASARYYPSTIELPDGKVLIFYGQSTTVDSYDPETNTIARLPASANRSDVDLYPRMHVLPDGKIFNAGPERQTLLFDPATNTWSPMGLMAHARSAGSSVLLPGLNKVLASGGNSGAQITKTADIIDFSAATPQWRPTASMNLARQDQNTLLLPDGTVLAVGGKGGGTIPKQAELFDPVTETWTLMAAQSAQRAYHSIAVLLPDGRVLSAGDGDGYRLTGEIYSPPYLFKGPRPTIESVSSSSLGYGTGFTIETPNAGEIARVALVKPGPVSHGVNFDQRYLDLAFERGDGAIAATAPGGPNLAPPGWYMLFVLNDAGVPSVASWVRVRTAPEPGRAGMLGSGIALLSLLSRARRRSRAAAG